ncbi:IS200/IS605 family transposase [Candidatus Hepatincolaceae symbiont of Richtersius coronifer]
MDITTKKSQIIRTGRHCVFNLHVHLVFITKYRQKIFTQEYLETMKTILNDVCLDFNSNLVEFDGEIDHVHLLVNYPPQVQLSKLINSLKGVSSRMLKKQYPEITKHYFKNKALWSPSYFASSCGGAPIEIVKQYIQQQKTPN